MFFCFGCIISPIQYKLLTAPINCWWYFSNCEKLPNGRLHPSMVNASTYIYIYDWYYINIYIYVCWCFWLAMSERIGSSTRPSGCCHPAESLPCGPLEVQDDAVPGNVCAEVQFIYPSEPGNIGPLPMCIPWISKLSQRIRIQQAYMPEFCLWF